MPENYFEDMGITINLPPEVPNWEESKIIQLIEEFGRHDKWAYCEEAGSKKGKRHWHLQISLKEKERVFNFARKFYKWAKIKKSDYPHAIVIKGVYNFSWLGYLQKGQEFSSEGYSDEQLTEARESYRVGKIEAESKQSLSETQFGFKLLNFPDPLSKDADDRYDKFLQQLGAEKITLPLFRKIYPLGEGRCTIRDYVRIFGVKPEESEEIEVPYYQSGQQSTEDDEYVQKCKDEHRKKKEPLKLIDPEEEDVGNGDSSDVDDDDREFNQTSGDPDFNNSDLSDPEMECSVEEVE